MCENPFSGRGQINMNSKFGQEIYEICKNDKYRNIFETGTWNGQGSTVCVMNAIINKENSILYSLEADKKQFKKAIEFWMDKSTKNKLNLMNGILHTKIADEDDIRKKSGGVIPFYNEHYIPEKNLLDPNNIINIEYIQNIDIIILDGGEYSTREDFNLLLAKNPKVIILDDCNVYKCKDIRKTLLEDENWNIYKENLNDRNGWSIFIRL
jgi:hypothetical protein